MSTTEIIRLNYAPRVQFVPFHNRTQRWCCIVAHRRAGKTVACIHDLVRAACRTKLERARFAYIAPTYSQAKTAAFDYLRDAVGPTIPLGTTTNISELRVDLYNGSQVRLFGADNYDALRGMRLDGVVLDEFADFDPRAWSEVIRPALSDRRGFAVFIGTPKGHNEFYNIAKRARDSADWLFLEIKASETAPYNDKIVASLKAQGADLEDIQGMGLVTTDELADSRKSMTEDQYAQEYECSFDAAIKGSYYGHLINDALKDQRISNIPYEPSADVWTAWDLGIRDATAIWFCQKVGKEVRLINYYENSGVGLDHYAKIIRGYPYVYAGHIVPHDAQAKELGTGKNRIEVLESLGLRNIQVAPRHSREDGINAVRLLLPRCWIDSRNCERGIEALKLYHAAFDEKLKAFKAEPVHDWTSHAADALRYLAITLDGVKKSNFNRKIIYPKGGYY